MVRYVPIPPVDLDPRNEREVVELSALKVFEASNGLLSDFSESSPIRAVLEGQAFAYNEFLSYFNQIPEALLIEWIGPFLGAQRRVGSSSFVTVTLTLSTPAEQPITIPTGFKVSTDPSKNNGILKEYVLIEPITIPRRTTSADGIFQCTTRGSQGNCLPNSISNFQPISGILSVTNKQAGYGGTDIETIQQTKERFLSLIRRRVPVSESDWRGVFQDLFGINTTLFLEHGKAKNSVTFNVLKPGLDLLSEKELWLATDTIRNLVPMGYSYEVKNIPVERIITEIICSYSNLPQTRLDIADLVRGAVFVALQGNALPADVNLTNSDLRGYVSANLGIGEPYLNPDILSFRSFMTPRDIVPMQSRGKIKEFTSDNAVKVNDLVYSPELDTYYPALESFNPTIGTKQFYANQGFLRLELVQPYESGRLYKVGEILGDSNDNIRVVLNPFTASGNIIGDFESSNVSQPKIFTDWTVGTSYSQGTTIFDPDVIQADTSDFEVDPFLPTQGVGSGVWVVYRNFTREADTTNIGTAQAQSLLGLSGVTYDTLVEGSSYTAGNYIITPDISLQDEYDPSLFYISPSEGVIKKAFIINESFVQDSPVTNLYAALSIYAATGTISPVDIVETSASQFLNTAAKYRARHRSGERIRTDTEVFLVVREFTPFTQNTQTLVDFNYLRPLSDVVPALADPLFEINFGDVVSLQFRGRKRFFTSLASFTAVYNPDVYLRYLEPTGPQSEFIPFYNPNRKVEDTIIVDNVYYRVIKPFTPNGETIRELEKEGFIQRLAVEILNDEQIQASKKFVTLPGDSFIQVGEKNKGDTLYYYSETGEVEPPLFRGACLF
jgi:hypothetical protein